MNKIKILTDSACDISRQDEMDYEIKVMCFPVTVGEKSYRERHDFSPKKFYEMMDGYEGIPTTAQITQFEFCEEYEKLFSQGYTSVIHVTISSTGSNTYNAAVLGKKAFFAANPIAEKSFSIDIIDSKNYTGVYGYPVVQAAMKAEKGATTSEIIAYLNDWFASAKVLFAAYTLEYVKKSGRVSCAAAFVGELLGLRPIIKIEQGVSTTMEKVRGDKSIIPKLAEICAKEIIPQTPYIIVKGSVDEYGKEMAYALTKALGYPPSEVCQIGAAVACNAGHKVAGVIYKGK